jgi:hypothetical protein
MTRTHAEMVAVLDAASERFWANVDQTDESGCWLWTGYRNPKGYGQFAFGNGRRFMAHRLAFAATGQVIPEEMQLDHLCRVRNCVNPGHLEIVTSRENTLRGVSPPAVAVHNETCPYGHPYDRTAVSRGRRYRSCSQCVRDEWHRREARRRAAEARDE